MKHKLKLISEDFNICQGDAQIDLPFQVENQILNGLDPTEYSVTIILQNQMQSTKPMPLINQTISIPADATLITIWARLVENNNQECFDITNFNITIDPVPPVDDLPDIFEWKSTLFPTYQRKLFYRA